MRAARTAALFYRNVVAHASNLQNGISMLNCLVNPLCCKLQ
ncbi:hypothetical protein HMPREF9248_0024 [Fannyhessea vaginae PB189-T1-4]|uniref:Uncharacterized protein n=1 Tax=Fannyhessea vaginae PB189-T1-4 TaxID=866774 RepID=A0ABN0B1S0_9ACTN|nr:hypothetical protein HMPREF9248_0024 [Fannyhessea vaginae PB189-T1-4]